MTRIVKFHPESDQERCHGTFPASKSICFPAQSQAKTLDLSRKVVRVELKGRRLVVISREK